MLLIPSLKKKTRQLAVEILVDPLDFYIPLEGYRSSMKIVVKVGDYVKKYGLIAQSSGAFPSKIHAPVSGVVKEVVTLDGKSFVHLENDFKDTTETLKPLSKEGVGLKEFISFIQDYGIQGAGGSQFPTQLKYQLADKPLETLIVNGVECEPYLSADYALMKEYSQELIMAAQLIAQVLEVKQVVFAIEKQHAVLRKTLLKAAKDLKWSIKVKLVSNYYPQGGELQLIRSVTKQEIRKGSLPRDYGVLVSNVGTLWAIYRAAFEGIPYVERIVTVSGNSEQLLGNYVVKIGTPVHHIIQETKNRWDITSQTIVLGGAMMGKAIESIKTPIHKGAGGVLILKKQKLVENNCIKCGLCVDVCPQRLMPLEFVRHIGNVTSLKGYNLQDCIECGACAYVCPSDVPLMENIFEGKLALSSSSRLQEN